MKLLYTILFLLIQLSVASNAQECNSTKEFKCIKEGIKKCMPIEWKCDNVDDCDDGEDEMGCNYTHRCNYNQLSCKNGDCVPRVYKCDGADDCGDGSDEIGCDWTPHQLLGVTPCSSSQFHCQSGQCLERPMLCDGIPDCSPTGEDEENCPNSDKCPPNHTYCYSNGYCMSNDRFCDGIEDCQDGIDEKNCQVDCRGKFQCKTDSNQTQVCIPMNEVCNGLKDCPNGDDETEKCVECRDKKCEYLCNNTPNGAQCYCQEGYKLQSDGLSCDNVDDCIGHGCQHYCEDKIGGYTCGCVDGFRLNDDGHTCRVSEGVSLVSRGPSVEIVTPSSDLNCCNVGLVILGALSIIIIIILITNFRKTKEIPSKVENMNYQMA